MLALETPAPAFELTCVVSEKVIKLSDYAEKALLMMFICRHCPYVKHVERELAKLGHDYAAKPIGIVAISSNDAIAYPADAPESLREQATDLGFNFPYCYDGTQSVARAYTAVCTPDFFLFDDAQKLVYRGQLDGSRPRNNVPVTGQDLRAAIDAVLSGQPVDPNQIPSLGCNIKWKH